MVLMTTTTMATMSKKENDVNVVDDDQCQRQPTCNKKESTVHGTNGFEWNDTKRIKAIKLPQNKTKKQNKKRRRRTAADRKETRIYTNYSAKWMSCARGKCKMCSQLNIRVLKPTSVQSLRSIFIDGTMSLICRIRMWVPERQETYTHSPFKKHWLWVPRTVLLRMSPASDTTSPSFIVDEYFPKNTKLLFENGKSHVRGAPIRLSIILLLFGIYWQRTQNRFY